MFFCMSLKRLEEQVLNDNMKNKKFLISFLIIGTLFFAGCGLPKAGDNIVAAINSIKEGDCSQAFADLDEAEAQGENKQLIARARGIASYHASDYQGAVNYYLECLSLSDSKVDELDYDVNFYLAQAYEKLGDYAAAIDTYSSILALDKSRILAYYNRGCDYLKSGEHDLAMSDFNQALAMDENNYDLRIEVAGRLSECGYVAEGTQFLSDFLAEKEKKLSDYDKGRIYYYMGDFENARIHLEKARDDDDQNVILFLGKTYEKLGDYNYAASVYDTFLKRHPENALIYNQLGLSKMAIKDYTGALDAFNMAEGVENNGFSQTLMYNKIIAYEYCGDFTQAKNLMSTYMKRYPDDTAAQRESVFLSTR